MRFLIYIWMLATMISGLAYAQPAGVFQVTLPPSGTRLNQFQVLMTQGFNGLFSDVRGVVSAKEVQDRLVDPLFDVLGAYLAKENYLATAALPETKKLEPNCQLFAYCSLCHQSQDFAAQMLDNIHAQLVKDPKTARVLQVYDGIMTQASSSLKLTSDANYQAPKNFAQLLKNMVLGGMQPQNSLKNDLLYFQLIAVNSQALLHHMRSGAYDSGKFWKRIQGYFENDKAFVFQELMACPQLKSMSKKSLAKPVPGASVSPASPTKPEPESHQSKPPYVKYKDQSFKRLFQFFESEDKK